MSATSNYQPRNIRDIYRFPNDPQPAVPGKRNITPKSFRDAQAADGRLAMVEYREREFQTREQMARLRALRLANRQNPSPRSVAQKKPSAAHSKLPRVL